MSAPGGTRTPRQASPVEISPPSDPDELLIYERLQRSRTESIPISRHRLAGLVATKSKISLKDALRTVDRYCDGTYPFVPDYLGKELAIPFLKFFAVVTACLSLGMVGFTITRFKPNDQFFPIGIVATLVLAGIAALLYVRSLVGEFSETDD